LVKKPLWEERALNLHIEIPDAKMHLYGKVLPGCSVCSQEFIIAFRLNCWKNKRSEVLARS
jgi:hypothetical protein